MGPFRVLNHDRLFDPFSFCVLLLLCARVQGGDRHGGMGWCDLRRAAVHGRAGVLPARVASSLGRVPKQILRQSTHISCTRARTPFFSSSSFLPPRVIFD